MDSNSRIFVAGGSGMVGGAIVRRLRTEGLGGVLAPTSAQLDLQDQAAVRAFFQTERPTHVFLAAALVGGIRANDTYPADFIYSNLEIQMNVIHASWMFGATKLLFLGSSCIYPKFAPQPLKEEYLLTGALEPTNEAYAVAKIAGIQMCRSYNRQHGTNFVSVMPTNLYGPNDNYDPLNSHVLPGLLRRFHEAKVENRPEVVVWGTGTPRREFLHVDDLADACAFVMRRHDGSEIVNIGTGEDIAIADVAALIAEVVGYRGAIRFDPSKPDGTPRKLLDVGRLHELGWRHRTSLRDGIRSTYEDFVRNGGRAPRHRGGAVARRAE